MDNISSVQLLSRVWLFVTPWIAACQASLSTTNSWSLLKLVSMESAKLYNYLILCCPLVFLPQSFPSSGSFQMSQFFASGGQSIGTSALASVLPMNSQDWFPLGLTGLISFQSKGLSRVFSNTTVQKHQFFWFSLLYGWNIHQKELANMYWLEEMPTISSVQFSCSVISDSLRPHELQHTRPPCPSPTPRVHPDSRPSSQWCHPAISSSVVPFSSCLLSLPASKSFPMSQLFAWSGQSTGVSALASFLPKKSQG